MRKLIQLGFVAVTLAATLHAAEFANLRNGFSIRHERHETSGEITRLYTSSDGVSSYVDVPTAQVEGFESAPSERTAPELRPAPDLNAIIREVSRRSQVDADFIASVIRAESGNNPNAVSRKGARGLMQLMPSTAGQLGVKDSFDAADNVDGGVRYLLALLQQFNFDVPKALAAYNAGPHRVVQYNGVPPYRETRAYVARIIKDYNRKKLAERKQARLAKDQSAPVGGTQ